MSNIDLKRFVDINIKQSETSYVSGTRDVLVLFTSEQTDGQPHLLKSLADAAIYENSPNTKAHLEMYFNNGGAKVYVVENTAATDITATILANLPQEYILIGSADSNSYSALKTLAKSMTSKYGIDEKLIFARSTDTSDDEKIKNFVVKYSTTAGAEMTMPAYLSKIDINGIDSVHDYMYTQENVASQDIDTATYDEIISNNINVDVTLAGAVRNCGGNCKDGVDLVNTYVRIILHQTLTDRLIQLLSQKLKSSSGIGKIYSAISGELEKYLRCGYLTTDKIWMKETLSISGADGKMYTIIEKGTPLTSGYLVKVLPMTSLTNEDILLRKAPPIYVVIADQYSIRQITINGEVI